MEQLSNTSGRCISSSADNGRFGDINININVQLRHQHQLQPRRQRRDLELVRRDTGRIIPEAWCTNSLLLGCQSYTKKQAINIIANSVSGDMTYALAAHLAAAKLNVDCLGTDSSCISDPITAADQFLCTYPVGSNLAAKSKAWQNFSSTFQTLVDYNEGKLCAPPRE